LDPEIGSTFRVPSFFMIEAKGHVHHAIMGKIIRHALWEENYLVVSSGLQINTYSFSHMNDGSYHEFN
jgi:hypothetical protein